MDVMHSQLLNPLLHSYNYDERYPGYPCQMYLAWQVVKTGGRTPVWTTVRYAHALSRFRRLTKPHTVQYSSVHLPTSMTVALLHGMTHN